MTRGDNYNIACPHCGKINHYVTHGIKVSHGVITEFIRSCYHCRQNIHYSAQWEITLLAEAQNEPTRPTPASDPEQSR